MRISLTGFVVAGLALVCLGDFPVSASEPVRSKRLLLIGQGPDGHPFTTHEYRAGVRLMARMLQPVKNLQTIVVSADGDWQEGPELIAGADGVMLFVSQGAKWIHDDAARLAAFQELQRRGGGFVGLHWGVGTRKAEFIENYVQLFGACHGGPDRKYKVLERVTTQIAAPKHPILSGVEPVTVKEEFYYKLKLAKPADQIVPLIKVPIDGEEHMVGWAWERPNGGRSFGFTGGHFHKNWNQQAYRRLMTQGVLWTLKLRIPSQGLSVDVTEEDVALPKREEP